MDVDAPGHQRIRPDDKYSIIQLRDRFYSRLWSLRFLVDLSSLCAATIALSFYRLANNHTLSLLICFFRVKHCLLERIVLVGLSSHLKRTLYRFIPFTVSCHCLYYARRYSILPTKQTRRRFIQFAPELSTHHFRF